MHNLRQQMASGNFSDIAQMLQLCWPPNSSLQTSNLIWTIASSYIQIVEENLSFNTYPFYQTINATLELNDSLAIIGAAMNISLAI